MTNSNRLGNLLLDAALMQQLQTAIEKIEQQQLTDKAKALELCFAYVQYAQFDKAVETLEELINTEGQNPLLLLTLADILAIKGESSLARERYTEAIELASNSSDPQDREVIIVARAELAISSLQEAQTAQTELEELKKEEWRSDGELSDRIKAIFNEDRTLNSSLTWSNSLASRSRVCNCTIPPNNIPGRLIFVDGTQVCSVCR